MPLWPLLPVNPVGLAMEVAARNQFVQIVAEPGKPEEHNATHVVVAAVWLV